MNQMLNARNYEEEAEETLRAVGDTRAAPMAAGRS
jgi:hypothetical protein